MVSRRMPRDRSGARVAAGQSANFGAQFRKRFEILLLYILADFFLFRLPICCEAEIITIIWRTVCPNRVNIIEPIIRLPWPKTNHRRNCGYIFWQWPGRRGTQLQLFEIDLGLALHCIIIIIIISCSCLICIIMGQHLPANLLAEIRITVCCCLWCQHWTLESTHCVSCCGGCCCRLLQPDMPD